MSVSFFRHRNGSAPAASNRSNRARLRRAAVEALEGRTYMASIAGHVYDDSSGNGIGADPGLGGVVVQLWDSVNGSQPVMRDHLTTDADGSYVFTGVPVDDPNNPGTCDRLSVKIVQQAGWQITYPASDPKDTQYVPTPSQDQEAQTDVDWLEAARPVAPSGLTASASGPFQVDLSWADNSMGEDSFYVERSPADQGSWSPVSGVLPPRTTTFSDTATEGTGIADGTAYDYRVTATTSLGVSDPCPSATVTTPLASPSQLSATAAGPNELDLSWTNNSATASGFLIDRSDDSGATWTTIDNVQSWQTTYPDTSASDGTTYSYRVSAVNDLTVSGPSDGASATTPVAPPSDLSATAVGPFEVDLGWTDNSDGTDSFVVQRSPAGENTWMQVGSTLPAGTTQLSDIAANGTGLQGGTSYDYRVIATKGGSDSNPSGTASATTDSADYSVNVGMDTSEIPVGQTVDRAVTATDASGNLVAVTLDVTSQDPGIAEPQVTQITTTTDPNNPAELPLLGNAEGDAPIQFDGAGLQEQVKVVPVAIPVVHIKQSSDDITSLHVVRGGYHRVIVTTTDRSGHVMGDVQLTTVTSDNFISAEFLAGRDTTDHANGRTFLDVIGGPFLMNDEGSTLQVNPKNGGDGASLDVNVVDPVITVRPSAVVMTKAGSTVVRVTDDLNVAAGGVALSVAGTVAPGGPQNLGLVPANTKADGTTFLRFNAPLSSIPGAYSVSVQADVSGASGAGMINIKEN